MADMPQTRQHAFMGGAIHQIAHICRHARWIFRSHLWIEVNRLLKMKDENEEHHGCEQNARSVCVETNVKDAYTALQNTNWCAVHMTHGSFLNAPHSSTMAQVSSPVCVVMMRANVKYRPISDAEWSDNFIDDIVQNSVQYGTIESDTHVIVQIFFEGLCQTAYFDKALCVVVVDQAGIAYCYNMPRGACEHVAFLCITKLLQNTIGCAPSMFNNVVNYSPRTPYDDCLYTMFITAACCTETVKSKIRNCNNSCSDLINCRPSARSARATRVVANMRFLMLLCRPTCASIVDDLLLDEINVLDEFRSVTTSVHVECA